MAENFCNLGDNLFEEERIHIFGKMYLANVRNRLRELEFPNDVDCKRWIWELVQNAKDSISNQPERNGVDIKVKVENDIYSFTHNGSPFTIKTLFALLYKYTEGKTNNGESTGRFGTGFLTTHSLSKIVKINGDIIFKNQNTVQGFKLIMNREGEDEELLDGLKKTEKSLTITESTGWTTFEYEAKTTRNKEAGKLGIQNFKENISKVMLFCPEIKSIELNDNGKILSITRNDIIDTLSDGCKKLTLNQKDGEQNSIRSFLYIEIKEHNDKLSEKFNIDRNIRICCAIELDKDNNIVINPKSPCLFCSLPLVGSEVFELPFIINSPDFEPDSERQTILLDGNDISEETRKISEPGINKMILLKSQEMYRTLINYISSTNIKNRHLLARGISLIPNVTRFFDRKWYEKNFMIPMRKILLEFPVIWNGIQYYKLTEINLPIIKNYAKIEDQKKAYDFISKLCNNVVPTFEESKKFEKCIWKHDSMIKYIDIEACVKIVESTGKIYSLNNKYNITWNWYDDFLVFIKCFHPEYLEKYAIIPNMNLEFVKLTNDIASSKNVPNNMIECLTSLGVDWKQNHIHKNINNYSTGTDHDIDYAVSKIHSSTKDNLNNSLILMQYIPLDNEDEKYIEKRNNMLELCSVVWEEKTLKKKDGNKFPKEIWDRIEPNIVETIIMYIQLYGLIGSKYSVDFIKKFLIFIKEYYPNYIYNKKILPNQNEILCNLKDLCEDDKIPDEFKKCLKDCFEIDIKKNLLDERFNFLNLFIEKKRIYDFNDVLEKEFKICNLSFSFKGKEAAIRLIKIIPKANENETNDNFQEKQRRLFDLYKIFTKENCESIEIDRNDSNEGIWKYSNPYIYDIITNIIEKYNNVEILSKYLGKNQDETIDLLKMFTSYTKKGKINVNQNNELCNLVYYIDNKEYYNLFNEGIDDKDKIPENLKDISKNLGYDVRKYLAHEKMERPCLNNISYIHFCIKIDDLIAEKYKNSSNFTDTNFKNAANSLIEEYFDKIGEEKAKTNFPRTFENKENIILNVIYDKQTRKNMTEYGKSYGSGTIKILLDNPKLVKSIISGELTDSNYDSKCNASSSNDSEYKKYFVVKKGAKKIKISYNNDLIQDDTINFYQSTFNDVINYGDDLDFGNTIKKISGNSGEAYIYELLKSSKKYKKVEWKMLDETGKGKEFEYRGKKYNLSNDYSHYDIIVETFENYKLYIEVKSTICKFGNKVPFFLSPKQIKTMESINPPDKYILAVVFDVMINPKHFFMELSVNLN